MSKSLILFGDECDGGWGYMARSRSFVTDEKTVTAFPTLSYETITSSTCDFNPETQKCHGKLVEKLFGNCRDFIEAIVNRNENAHNLIEFLMENSGTVGFISHVVIDETSSSNGNWDHFPYRATHYVEKVCFGKRMFIIFDDKNADLLGDGDKKDILDKIWKKQEKLTKNQENIFCSVLIFSKSFIKMQKLTMKEILQRCFSFSNYRHPLVCKLEYLPGVIPRSTLEDGEYFEVLTDQIFELYWFKKLLENEIRISFMDQFPLQKSFETFNKNEKLMSNLKKITSVWDQKLKQGIDLLDGKDVTMLSLWASFPIENIFEMKKQMKSTQEKSASMSESDVVDFAS